MPLAQSDLTDEVTVPAPSARTQFAPRSRPHRAASRPLEAVPQPQSVPVHELAAYPPNEDIRNIAIDSAKRLAVEAKEEQPQDWPRTNERRARHRLPGGRQSR